MAIPGLIRTSTHGSRRTRALSPRCFVQVPTMAHVNRQRCLGSLYRYGYFGRYGTFTSGLHLASLGIKQAGLTASLTHLKGAREYCVIVLHRLRP